MTDFLDYTARQARLSALERVFEASRDLLLAVLAQPSDPEAVGMAVAALNDAIAAVDRASKRLR